MTKGNNVVLRLNINPVLMIKIDKRQSFDNLKNLLHLLNYGYGYYFLTGGLEDIDPHVL